MDSGPAVFAGVCLFLFGAVLLLWTCVRVVQRRPVAHGVPQARAAVLAGCFGLASFAVSLWLVPSG